MAFQISPGVNVSEIDLTTIVPSSSTTDGAVAGVFSWGPLDDVELIGDENELVRKYGKPNNDTFVYFYTAANFLAYGNKLRVVRVADNDVALNASVGTTNVLIKNDDHYDNQYAGGEAAATVGEFVGKYPGALGNSLKVSICGSSQAFEGPLTGTALINSNGDGTSTIEADTVPTLFTQEVVKGSVITLGDAEYVVVADPLIDTEVIVAGEHTDPTVLPMTAAWEYKDAIGVPPDTTAFGLNKGITGDEMHIVVVDEDGLWTGIPGSILERISFVSKAADAKSADGASLYYAEVVNRKSKYIRWTNHPEEASQAAAIGTFPGYGELAATGTFDESVKPLTFSFVGGADGATTVAPADLIRGYDLFSNAELVEVALILGANAGTAVALQLINICETRKDCICLLSPEFDDCVDNVGNEAEDVIQFRETLPSSSYAVLDSGWKYQYDKYNDVYRWVPLNGDVGGLCVRTDTVRDPWWSPAGLNRGQIKNVIKLAWNPYKAERDDLYLKGVNSVVTFPGQGTVLWGDKTLLAKPSAFDRINVRRLFIVLEKSIAKASRYTLFEFNDEFTRAQFRNLIEPYLRDVQGRRGIYDFRVVCDETNNTGEVIDRNEFIGDIYIKPARSINFIQLNFIAVRTGVDFEEIVGKF